MDDIEKELKAEASVVEQMSSCESSSDSKSSSSSSSEDSSSDSEDEECRSSSSDPGVMSQNIPPCLPCHSTEVPILMLSIINFMTTAAF